MQIVKGDFITCKLWKDELLPLDQTNDQNPDLTANLTVLSVHTKSNMTMKIDEIAR